MKTEEESKELKDKLFHLQAKIAAMVASVSEMSIGVGLPNFFIITGPDGKEYSCPPQDAKSFYVAIREKWERDLESLAKSYEDNCRENDELKDKINEFCGNICERRPCEDETCPFYEKIDWSRYED